MNRLTLLFAAYSVVSASAFLLAYQLMLTQIPKTALSRIAATVLLVSLALLQYVHWNWGSAGTDPLVSPAYLVAILAAPPAFYFFSRSIVMPDSRMSVLDIGHSLPLLTLFLLKPGYVVLVSLVIGAAYSVWLQWRVLGIQRTARRTAFEKFFFSVFAVMALLMLGAGIALNAGYSGWFYQVYAAFIGLALIAITIVLVGYPELLAEFSEAARATYAKTTLSGIPVNEKLGELKRLMETDKLYQDERLSLSMLANQLDLSSHQLSELINTQFGHGFSHYIRQQRVDEAKRLLIEQRDDSVLSVGMSVGFKTQSNFYTAFRSLVGVTPGAYRKLQSVVETPE